MRERFCWLACKRLWRTVSFPLLLFVCAAAIFFAPCLGREESLPPAAVYDADGSAIAVQVTEQLCENGFVLCLDEAALREGVRDGSYDCGVILPAGFGDALSCGALDEALLFVTSPTSFVPELYQNHVTAAVFSAYAPYITANVLADTPITEEEVLAEYDALMQTGYRFSFSLVDGDEAIEPANVRTVTYTISAAALFLFALLAYGSCDVLTRDCTTFARRIGVGAAMRRILIPGMTVRALGAMLAASAALLLAALTMGAGDLLCLIFPVCIYILLLIAFSVAVSALLPDAKQIRTLTCFLLLLSLVLCPIYTDVTLNLPWAAVFRFAVPPYWLWLTVDHPFACLLAVPIGIAFAFGLLRLRWRWRLPAPPAER